MKLKINDMFLINKTFLLFVSVIAKRSKLEES